MARKKPDDAIPAGWGFEDGVSLRAVPDRDWCRVEAAIVALVRSGYALAPTTQRRKIHDTMETFGLDGRTAERCLKVARGEPISGGRRWRRRGAWMSTRYPQTCAYHQVVDSGTKEAPRPLETDRGADSRAGAKSRTDGPESIGRPVLAQAPRPY